MLDLPRGNDLCDGFNLRGAWRIFGIEGGVNKGWQITTTRVYGDRGPQFDSNDVKSYKLYKSFKTQGLD